MDRLEKIREAVADYITSEGCGCCESDNHDDDAEVLAKLLDVEPYDDNSGYDFYKYATPKEQEK